MKFNNQTGDRSLNSFQVGYVDGQCKCLLMLAVISFCKELDFGEKELDDANLKKVLASFGSIRCSFEHYASPAQYFLQSLRALPAYRIPFKKQTPFPLWSYISQRSFSNIQDEIKLFKDLGIITLSSSTEKWATSQRRSSPPVLSKWQLICGKQSGPRELQGMGVPEHL